MKKLRLKSEAEKLYIEVSADFIDMFMPEATEEELKVYLYLKRALMDPSILLSLHDMADLFDVTPKKILQALTSWEEKGVVSLEYDDGEICGITLLSEEKKEERQKAAPNPVPDNVMPLKKPEKTAPVLKDTAPSQVLPLDISVLDTDEEFTELLSLAEFLTKNTVSWRMRDALGEAYLLFDRSFDIIEYLLEYCVEQGKANPSYIQSVARGWKKDGLKDLQEIREQSASRNKNVYSIKKAFGIRNRELVPEENDYIRSWTSKFDLDIILEACKRTVATADKPSFKYADSIITAWEKAGVRTLKDIDILDEDHRSRQHKKAVNSERRPVKTAFHNFNERHTDYNSLVEEYLES